MGITYGLLQNVFAAIFCAYWCREPAREKVAPGCTIKAGNVKSGKVLLTWWIGLFSLSFVLLTHLFFPAHCHLSLLILLIRLVIQILAPDHAGISWEVMRSSMNRSGRYSEALITWTCTSPAWLMCTWAMIDPLWSCDWPGMCSFKNKE